MRRFKNILIVVRDKTSPADDMAVVKGSQLAIENNARITLMDVIENPHRTINEYKGIIKVEELIDLMIEQRKRQLSDIAKQLEPNIDVQVKVCVGRDFIEIIRQMIFEKHDLLIKVANEHEKNFDSKDFHIMRKCPEPVWLLRPRKNTDCNKILAAIDLSLDDTEEGKQINKLIMDLATSLSQWENSELHVLSCWSLYGENALRDSSFMKVSEDELMAILLQEEENYEFKIRALTNQYEYFNCHTHLIKDDPVHCIPNFAEENNIDVVIMGTVGRSGIPGLLIGNTAETILKTINSSVITVKPIGFESPIR